jgi:hypothetical protein
MDKDIEYRTFTLDSVDKSDGHLVGHAAVFNQLSEDLGGFREKIDKGAFSKTISESDIRALHNHDSNYVWGRNKSGTLKLSEDDHGLAIDITPPDAQWARDVKASIDRGDINQMSFGFNTIKDEWDNSTKDNVTRTLKEVRLFDVSTVTYPAYPQTSVAVRAMLDSLKSNSAEPPDTGHSVAEPEKNLHSNDEEMKRVQDAIYTNIEMEAKWLK